MSLQHLEIVEDSIQDKGYSLACKLSLEELLIFKSYIHKQWLERISNVSQSLGKYIVKNEFNISNYHQISNDLDHSKLWNKKSRILKSDFLQWFQKSDFYNTLSYNFGSFEISDEEGMGFPNVYWRLVRPSYKEDIGPLHRDSWFWALNNDFIKPSYQFKRIKVWLAICCEPGLNGLLLEPRSHLRDDIKWSSEKRHGINKPVLKTKANELNPILIPSEPGQAIIFHDDLLHGGALNNGESTRISAEFTILKRI